MNRGCGLEIVGFEVAEHLVAVSEDRVVADARLVWSAASISGQTRLDAPRGTRRSVRDGPRGRTRCAGSSALAASTCLLVTRSRPTTMPRSRIRSSRSRRHGRRRPGRPPRPRPHGGGTGADGRRSRTPRAGPVGAEHVPLRLRRGEPSSSTSSALAYAVWMFMTDCTIASILPSTLCDWSIMNATLRRVAPVRSRA